jgi:hypothetical protein
VRDKLVATQQRALNRISNRLSKDAVTRNRTDVKLLAALERIGEIMEQAHQWRATRRSTILREVVAA